MIVKSLLSALLPAVAAASRFHPFFLEALASGTHIQYASINANGGEFWIGKDTITFCPLTAPNCASFSNETTISIYKPQSEAYMACDSPGGQDIYIKPGGALSFTEPHLEGEFPKNSLHKEFTYTRQKHTKGIGFLTFNHGDVNQFYACPVVAGKSPYQIFLNTAGFGDASVPSGHKRDCIGIQILAVDTNSNGAFQYE